MEFTSENWFFNPNPPGRDAIYHHDSEFMGPTNSSIFRRPGLQLNAMRVRDKLLGFLQCFANAKLAKKRLPCTLLIFQGNLLLINRQVLRIPKLEEDYWEITVRFHMVFVLLFICFVMIYFKGGRISDNIFFFSPIFSI